MKFTVALLVGLCGAMTHVLGQKDSTYFFQHRDLPIVYYEASEDLRTFLRDPSATLNLTALSTLRDGEKLTDATLAYAATIDSYRVERMVSGNYEIFLITPPKPYKTPLCYLIGIVYPQEKAGPLPEGYFTLERGSDLSGKPYNPFCAWVVQKGNLQHLNYGDKGIKDNPYDFLEKIVSHLTTEEEAEAGLTIDRKNGTVKVMDAEKVQKQARRSKKKQDKQR